MDSVCWREEQSQGSPALEGGSAPSPHPRPGVRLTHHKVSLPWHCCPGTRSCFMCREAGMSARSRGGSSCRDFTFGSWHFVGARQEAEELQTHSAPRCWQLLPGSELVKCSFIGLPFPTGSRQEALEGQVALPILSLAPGAFSEHFGMVGRESVSPHWWLVSPRL